MHAPVTRPTDHNAFCTFLKKQAVLDHVPQNIFQSGGCASRYLRNNDLFETPLGMNEPRLRANIALPDTVYYTVRLQGGAGKHPVPQDLRSLQNELASIFKVAGFDEMPIACRETWMADDWVRKELERFDEVMPAGHGQEVRCEQQKYQRTQGDMVLSFPFPASRIEDLQHAMAAVETHRQQYCSLGK